jgi:hypothetical protein
MTGNGWESFLFSFIKHFSGVKLEMVKLEMVRVPILSSLYAEVVHHGMQTVIVRIVQYFAVLFKCCVLMI